jgi:hypothetical protein
VQTVPAGTQFESIKIVFREYAPALGRTATGSHHLDPPGIVTVIPEWPLRIIRGSASVSRGLGALIIRPPSVISDSSSSSDDVEAADAEAAVAAAVAAVVAVVAGGGLAGETAFSAIIDSKRPRKKLSDTFDSYV